MNSRERDVPSGVDPMTPRYQRDPHVDAYIDSLPTWQQSVCREVRDLVHAADPAVEETIKRSRQPYFVCSGNVCALLAAKDHVNVFLYDGAIVADPDGIITGGHDNKTARTVAVRKGEPIRTAALLAMLRQIIANNRAGGCASSRRWMGRRRPARADRSPRHSAARAADAELVAFRVGQHDVVVVGVVVVANMTSAELDQAGDLSFRVVGVQVEVHLIPRPHWRPSPL